MELNLPVLKIRTPSIHWFAKIHTMENILALAHKLTSTVFLISALDTSNVPIHPISKKRKRNVFLDDCFANTSLWCVKWHCANVVQPPKVYFLLNISDIFYEKILSYVPKTIQWTAESVHSNVVRSINKWGMNDVLCFLPFCSCSHVWVLYPSTFHKSLSTSL